MIATSQASEARYQLVRCRFPDCLGCRRCQQRRVPRAGLGFAVTRSVSKDEAASANTSGAKSKNRRNKKEPHTV